VVWFDGPDLNEPRWRDFIVAMRHAAEGGAFPGVDPSDTGFDRLAGSSNPGVTIGLVSYEPGPDKGAPMLQSGRDSEPTLATEPGAYDGPSSHNDLWVSGIDATPTECAAWVTSWISRQLQRPVIRREWDQPATGPGAGLLGRARTAAAIEWWLAEPEEYLDSRGTFGRWRLTRQPPAREVHERP
jgi:hypothetical protein